MDFQYTFNAYGAFDGVGEMAKNQTKVGNWILHVPKVREFVSALRTNGFGHILKSSAMVA